MVFTDDFSTETAFEVVDAEHVGIVSKMPPTKVEEFQPFAFVSKNVMPGKIAITPATEISRCALWQRPIERGHFQLCRSPLVTVIGVINQHVALRVFGGG